MKIWAATCDFQQCGILTCVDSDEPKQPALKLRNSKWCAIGSLTVIENPSDLQRLWSDCAYAQADLRFCWSHRAHCWKSHVAAQLFSSILLRSDAAWRTEANQSLNKSLYELGCSKNTTWHVSPQSNWKCLGQFPGIPWNQTSDVHRGSTLIPWRRRYITWRWRHRNHDTNEIYVVFVFNKISP